MIAVDRSGRQRWRFATVGAAHDFAFKNNDTRSVVTEPVVVGGIVIAGSRDGNIYGIDLRSGKERWHETHDGGSWILGLEADRGGLVGHLLVEATKRIRRRRRCSGRAAASRGCAR